MNGLNLSIPHRLFFIRATVTIGLIVSFFLSLNLWGGQRYFPSQPVFETFFLAPPFDFILMGMSVIFLLCSLVFYNTRTFIFLALLVNVFLVLFDLQRLQPWFYIYNAVLFVLLFYNGRIDNPEKFTSVFIIVQIIFCSVYLFNGINQLRNPLFLETDYREILSPLTGVLSERQFSLFLKAGKVIPWLFVLSGISFLIVSVRYLAVSFAIVIHIALLILMFPTFNNNPALWLMNLVFAFCLILLFSGNTRQRYFSPTVLFTKPLFYFVLMSFCGLPLIDGGNKMPAAMSFNFKCGRTGGEEKMISEEEYLQLPFYSRAFCRKSDNGYLIDMALWCRNELNSEYFVPDSPAATGIAGTEEDIENLKELSLSSR